MVYSRSPPGWLDSHCCCNLQQLPTHFGKCSSCQQTTDRLTMCFIYPMWGNVSCTRVVGLHVTFKPILLLWRNVFKIMFSLFSLNSRACCFYDPSSSLAAWLACLFSEMLLRRAQIKLSVYIQEATSVHTDVCSLLVFDSFVYWGERPSKKALINVSFSKQMEDKWANKMIVKLE